MWPTRSQRRYAVRIQCKVMIMKKVLLILSCALLIIAASCKKSGSITISRIEREVKLTIKNPYDDIAKIKLVSYNASDKTALIEFADSTRMTMTEGKTFGASQVLLQKVDANGVVVKYYYCEHNP